MTKKKPLHIPTRYWIDENIETSGDGLSPETAFKTMNEALRAVYVPDGHDVIIVLPEMPQEHQSGAQHIPAPSQRVGTAGDDIEMQSRKIP